MVKILSLPQVKELVLEDPYHFLHMMKCHHTALEPVSDPMARLELLTLWLQDGTEFITDSMDVHFPNVRSLTIFFRVELSDARIDETFIRIIVNRFPRLSLLAIQPIRIPFTIASAGPALQTEPRLIEGTDEDSAPVVLTLYELKGPLELFHTLDSLLSVNVKAVELTSLAGWTDSNSMLASGVNAFFHKSRPTTLCINLQDVQDCIPLESLNLFLLWVHASKIIRNIEIYNIMINIHDVTKAAGWKHLKAQIENIFMRIYELLVSSSRPAGTQCNLAVQHTCAHSKGMCGVAAAIAKHVSKGRELLVGQGLQRYTTVSCYAN
ncbi:hypothetical protein C8Q76DRAFT_755012 [Earliella scabrosa]|nr:hypothetical protein C8Q76DRAFT_755012 [Earliella scabrosa]